jgi:PAS domain S-box-containing protein
LVTNGLWLTFQALGLLTTDGSLSGALYIGGLIWGLTGVGAWMYFISAFTGRSYHHNQRYRRLAVGVYVGLVTVKLTNPLYGLYVQTQVLSEPYPHLVVEPQLFYWVSFTLTYALVAISFYWLLDTFRDSPQPTLGLGALAVLSLVPIVPRVAIEALPTGVIPPVLLGVSFEPIGVTAFTLGVLIFVEDTFRRLERSARSEVFKQATNAVFVYDIHGELVETNRQAERLRSTLDIGCQTIESFTQTFKPADGDDTSSVVPLETDGSTRYFDITVNPMTVGAESVGTVAGVQDITERRKRKRNLELKERAMDEATVGITISDPALADNPLVYVNDGFVEQTGYSRTDVLGRNCRFLQGDDREQAALDDLREAIATEEPITVELRNYRKNGEQFWNRLSVTPIYDEAGDLVNHIGIQQDVTKRKERGRELQAEREQFQLLTESVEEYAFLVVGEDGDIQTWNEGARNLFGYDTETALGMPMARLHTEAQRKSGLPLRLLQQARIAGESSDDGWRVRADGSEFYADVRYAALETDAGEFRGHAAIVRDMTGERRQRRRTERFVEESDDVVSILEMDGTFEYISGSATRVLGHDPDDLLEESLFDYLHPDDRERMIEAFFTGVEEPDRDIQIDGRFESGEGGWLNVEVRCHNMRADDAIGGMLLYLRDVTDSDKRTRRLKAIFNGMIQFTGLLEPDGTVIEINDAALAFGGVDRNDVVGQPFSAAPWWSHSAEGSDRVQTALARAAKGEFVRYETEVTGVEHVASVAFSLSPVTDENGDVTLLVLEGRDITARRQQWEHLATTQRMRRQRLQSTLGDVREQAELLADESAPDERARQLKTIQRTLDEWEATAEKTERIQGAIQSQQDQQATVDASELVDEVVAASNEAFPAAVIEAAPADREPTPVPAIVGEALQEIVQSVLEATPDADSSVELRLTRATGDQITVTVSATSSELSEAEADVLEHGAAPPPDEDNEMDMWLIRMLVTQAGGDLSIDVRPDETTVTLRIPAGGGPATGTPPTTD